MVSTSAFQFSYQTKSSKVVYKPVDKINFTNDLISALSHPGVAFFINVIFAILVKLKETSNTVLRNT